MAPEKKANKATPVENVKHKDKRANIPTEELRDFVKEDETHPKTILYPRDPSLDPQLVWKGKDEQDREDLAIPALPVYIQEKIHPQAIIEDLRRLSAVEAQSGMKGKKEQAQLNLFADFNGLDFEQMIDFYQHEANWANRMILGDSLHVMTSLAEKEGLKGNVQMIYIDPPYGIKFGSNWQISTRKRDVKDGRVEDVTRQPEQIRAFRDTWKLGIHSYLSYLRDRLVIARELLTETGSVFVQIGDENVHLVRCLMDEVFGSENFLAQINFKSMSALSQQGLAKVYDYIVWYGGNATQTKFRPLYDERDISNNKEYRFLDKPGSLDGYRKIDEEEFRSLPTDDNIFRRSKLTSSGFTPSCTFTFQFKDSECRPFGNKSWRTNQAGIDLLIKANRIFLLSGSPYHKQYHHDFAYVQIENSWRDQPPARSKNYVVETAEKFVQRCLLMTTDPGDLVLDTTCGSGTTAYVAEQWGRRWITIDTSRVALALARTRIMSARYPYYLLADSPEGINKEAENTGKVPPDYKTQNNIKKGFVSKRVPHITLKSIANNPEIDMIHTRWQEKMETIRAKLNKSLKTSWEEWEVPSEAEGKWPKEVVKLHKEWWDLRKKRQEEIDQSIARNADQEVLYDQPYEDKKRIRVAGPFTVESLSPHRVLSTDEEMPVSEKNGRKAPGAGQFETMILDNLKKAGVQNTIKNERLQFERLEPYAGTWVQGEGEYTEKDGAVRRVAVSIGPEHGTVGPELVKEAAKEAVKGGGYLRPDNRRNPKSYYRRHCLLVH